MKSLRTRTYEILEVAGPGDTASRVFDVSMMGLIILNLIALSVETVVWIHSAWPVGFFVFECVSVGIFTVEYAVRVWCCVESPKYRRLVVGRLLFMLSVFAIIDLLAILPFYLPFLGLDLRFLRIARLFRVFRVAKLGRYSGAVRTLGNVLRSRKEELGVTLFVLIVLLLLASCLMYFAEHEAQPEVFSSIPAAMWWGVTTLTTVGYGDVYPVTIAGKIVASIIAILGIGMFALPTGILGAGFVEEMQKRKIRRCPHCEKELGE